MGFVLHFDFSGVSTDFFLLTQEWCAFTTTSDLSSFQVMLSIIWDSSFFLEPSIWLTLPNELGFIMGPLFAVLLCSYCFLHLVLSRSCFSLFFCNCHRKCVGGNPHEFLYEKKKFSHFLNYQFPLSLVGLRIFLCYWIFSFVWWCLVVHSDLRLRGWTVIVLDG